MNLKKIPVVLALIFCATQVQATTEAELQLPKIFPLDPDIHDVFGGSVSISGDRAVVGAAGAGVPFVWDGAAYVFRLDRAAGVWEQKAKILNPIFEFGSTFGSEVDLSGDVALIGAPALDFNNQSGVAFVYRFTNGEWVGEATLQPADGLADWFGVSLDVEGDLAVVGDYFHDTLGFNTGSVFVFRRQSGQWIQEAELLASDPASNVFFGVSVALWGDTIVVGASSDDQKGESAGAVYVYRSKGRQWTLEAKLTADDGVAWQNFGIDVSLSGDRLLVGAPVNDTQVSLPGAAYTFLRSGTTWTQEAKLVGADTGPGEQYGVSVSLRDDRALIGAHEDDPWGLLSGSAYLFRLQDGQWVEETKAIGENGLSEAEFGSSVSLTRHDMFVGAPQDPTFGEGAGAVHAGPLSDAPVAVGGAATGLGSISQTVCQNVDTVQQVDIPPTGDPGWNCEAAGLSVISQSRIAQQVIGTADLSLGNVGGSTTGLGAVLRVFCTNLTTGDQVQISQPAGNTWDCQAAGLIVQNGQQVRQRIAGRVE